jgi:hypothetical protein
VLAVNPNLLIIVEGIDYAGDLSGAYSQPIKDDPMGVDTLPLDLTVSNRLVYSPHNYPWLVNWNSQCGLATKAYGDMDAQTFHKCVGLNWGFLVTQWQAFTAPVWVGEFGASPDDIKQPWFGNLVTYLQGADFDWGYWALNVGPKAGGPTQVCGASATGDDNYGLLNADWSAPLTDGRITLLKSIESAKQGPGVGANDSCPAYGTAYVTGPSQDRSNGQTGDWDSQTWKATCAADERVVGLSVGGPSTSRYTHKSLCSTAQRSMTPTAAKETVISSRGQDTPHAKAHTSGRDWAPGVTKLECAIGEYVAGVSQTQQAQQYALHGILCRSASTTVGTVCNTRNLDPNASDDRSSTQPPDWDMGTHKAQCADNQYVAGVGVVYYPTQGVPQSLLCCNMTP